MKKILIVNNDMDTMTLLKKWLEIKHFEVKFTGDSGLVKDLTRDFAPDLLLIDILQKDVIVILKRDPLTVTLPIILMTGYTYRSKVSVIPADDSIDKPLNLTLLEKKISTLINKAGKAA